MSILVAIVRIVLAISGRGRRRRRRLGWCHILGVPCGGQLGLAKVFATI